MSKEQFNALIDRVGVQKVAMVTGLAMKIGGFIDAPPPMVVALLARCTQEELDAAKTVQQAFHLLMAQYLKYCDGLFEQVLKEEGNSGPELDLSFVKELADVTGSTQALEIGTAEAVTMSKPKSRDPLIYLPGGTTVH